MTSRDRLRVAIYAWRCLLAILACSTSAVFCLALTFWAFMQHDVPRGGGELLEWMRAVGWTWHITATQALAMSVATVTTFRSAVSYLGVLRHMIARRVDVRVRIWWKGRET